MSLKDRKITSEKLRLENKKMEMRLQQLKMTMNKEKEERILNNNGSIWDSGAIDSDIAISKRNNNAIISNKKLKIKMLKDEKIPEPKPLSNVKTIKKFNNNLDKLFSADDEFPCINLESTRKINGIIKCGQCEEVKAAVNCMECSEYYCAKCFAAFHLKGALRKHRSAPISASSGRVSIPSPLFQPPNLITDRSGINSNRKSVSQKQPRPSNIINQPNTLNSNRRASAEPRQQQQHYSEKQVLQRKFSDADFDEELSHQYFTEALEAWRNGVELTGATDEKWKTKKTTEHSTDMGDDGDNLLINPDKVVNQIHFTPGLSYAEQLLLKKYKNQQMQPDDMKLILSRLAKNTEMEMKENKELWEARMELESTKFQSHSEQVLASMGGLISEKNGNGDHIGVESLTDLWNQIDELVPFESTEIYEENPNNTSRPIVQYPDLTSQKTESAKNLKFANTKEPSKDYRKENSTIKLENIQKENEVIHKEQMRTINSKIPQSQMEKSAEKEDLKMNLEEETNGDINKKNKVLSTRRPKSSRIDSEFNSRPHSSRKMSARKHKGGCLTTDPSPLLSVLAGLGPYLTKTESSVTKPSKSTTTKSSRPSSKLSYSFYQHSSKIWKPMNACNDGDNVIDSLIIDDTEAGFSQFSSVTIPIDNEQEYITEELSRLDILPQIHNKKETFTHDNRKEISASIDILDTHEDSDSYQIDEAVTNGRYTKADEHDDDDHDNNDDDMSEQFHALQNEFNEKSRIEDDADNDTSDDNDDIIADSLDVTSSKEVRADFDKFKIEDSFDFKNRNPSSTTDENRNSSNQINEADYDSEEDGLSSSRFDDYKDVYNLR